MQDAMRIGAAALGGYVLGRTKKAKTAITLALWLAGKGRPSDVARAHAVKALQSDKGQELLAQLRGPVAGAGRQAALSLFEAQAGRLSDSLSRRTDLLTEPSSGGGSRRRRPRTRADDDENEDELSSRRGPANRKPDRDRQASRSRDADEDYDEDDDEYDDEYEDEDEEYEEDDAEDEDDDEGVEDEYDDEGAEDEDEYYEGEYEDEEYPDEDEEPTRRRRAS